MQKVEQTTQIRLNWNHALQFVREHQPSFHVRCPTNMGYESSDMTTEMLDILFDNIPKSPWSLSAIIEP